MGEETLGRRPVFSVKMGEEIIVVTSPYLGIGPRTIVSLVIVDEASKITVGQVDTFVNDNYATFRFKVNDKMIREKGETSLHVYVRVAKKQPELVAHVYGQQHSGTEEQDLYLANRLTSTAIATVPIMPVPAPADAESDNAQETIKNEDTGEDTSPIIGSGVIVSSKGVILTCAHVAHHAKNITFRYQEQLYIAERVDNEVAQDYEKKYDLAVYRINKDEKVPETGGFVTICTEPKLDAFTGRDGNNIANGFLSGFPVGQRTFPKNIDTDQPITVVNWPDEKNHITIPKVVKAHFHSTIEVKSLDSMSGGPLVRVDGQVLGIFYGDDSLQDGIFIPLKVMKECINKLSRNSKISWDEHLFLSADQLKSKSAPNKKWQPILNGLQAHTQYQMQTAAGHFLMALQTINDSADLNDPDTHNYLTVATQSLARLGPTASSAIVQTLYNSMNDMNGSKHLRDKVFASLLEMVAPYGVLPRDILRYSLDEARSKGIIEAAINSIAQTCDLSLVTQQEFDQIWKYAHKPVKIDANLSPTKVNDNLGPTNLAIYAIGRLVYNNKDHRYQNDIGQQKANDNKNRLQEEEALVKDFLVTKLKSDSQSYRAAVASAIHDARNHRALWDIEKPLNDTHVPNNVKWRLIDAIGTIGFDEGVDILRPWVDPTDKSLSKQEYENIRDHSLKAIGKIGTDTALDILTTTLKEGSSSAAAGLVRFGGTDALQKLKEAFFYSSPKVTRGFCKQVLEAILSFGPTSWDVCDTLGREIDGTEEDWLIAFDRYEQAKNKRFRER